MREPLTGYLPAAVAVAVSLLACLAFTIAGTAGAEADAAAGLLALVLVPVPMVVSVVWGSTVVISRPHRVAFVAAGVWLAVGWLLFRSDTVWPLASHVAAGLVAGIALGARWRLDAALAGIATVLVPLAVWSLVQLPVDEQFELLREEMAPLLEEALPAGAEPKQREQALALQREQFDKLLDLSARVYPVVMVLGLLGQGLVILVLVWLMVRVMGWRLASWRPPPFGRWRMPFYLVWMLAAGVGLLVTRQPVAMHIGLNLALLAGFLLSIQGIAVQFHGTARMLSPLGRVVFWTVMGLFLTPVVVPAGVVLGLADQWFDLRGLDRAASPQDGANEDP